LGRTCLYIAAKSGFYQLCRYFFDRCKNLNKIDEYINKVQKKGNTALHTASYFGHEDIVCLLLAYKTNKDILNSYGYKA
jgi:ankyrin repeat protein